MTHTSTSIRSDMRAATYAPPGFSRQPYETKGSAQNHHKVWVNSTDRSRMPTDVSLLQRARTALPSGVRLPRAEWEQRHRWIVRLLWLHVPIIVVYGLATGNGVVHSVTESLPTAFMGFLGGRT